ncbi:MAG: bifunctional phosphoglucose/phosphomannose isomerase [Actinobacteria bacterium]|nr:bifunctional phosphoglucose/phosphomannose isomerase [Actinomycetota bacterium]
MTSGHDPGGGDALKAAEEGRDPQRMLDAVLSLPEHCRRGYAVGRETPGLPSGDGVTTITVYGMGGSGVSGDLVRSLFRERLAIPIDVVKGPVLPEYCQKDTLVVCSSYSGETAETLSCFEEAARRGCRALAISTGGTLAARAEEASIPLVRIPAEVPVPRAALGFLAFGLLGALEAIGIVPPLESEVQHTVRVLADLAGGFRPDADGVTGNRAAALAESIGDRHPVIWGADGIGAVAAGRWKTQMNENAKVAAWASVLPELDHNEVVGWSAGQGERFFVIALRHEEEHPDVAARFPVSLQIASESGAGHEEVHAEGASPLARLLSLIMTGDATSVYLAYLRGVDPTPIEAIDRIKAALAEEGG